MKTKFEFRGVRLMQLEDGAKYVHVEWDEVGEGGARRRKASSVSNIPYEVFEKAAARFQKHFEAPAAYYIVQEGDTLSEIAERFSWGWRELAERNNIANPDVIYPGQRIWLNAKPVER